MLEPPPSPPLHFLLLLLLLISAATTTTSTTPTTTTEPVTETSEESVSNNQNKNGGGGAGNDNDQYLEQKFKEAPQFYNSPDCPVIPPPSYLTSNHTLHIAMTLDLTYIRGSMAAILSVLQHSSCPQNTFFHFITDADSNHHYHHHRHNNNNDDSQAQSQSQSLLLRSTISSTFPYLRFTVYPFDTTRVSSLISTSIRSALDCPLNYARSYLPSLLPPYVTRTLYLDSDTILVDDISSLLSTLLPPQTVLAAPEYCNANFTSYFTPTFWSNPSLSLTFTSRRRPPCYFNTGVMVIDLARWRNGDYTRRIEEWMELQKRIRIYELGSLPPFLLVFAGEIEAVDHRWNQHGLGGDNFRGLCRDLHPGRVSLLHWSGKGKPWVRLDKGRPCPLDALWAPYDLLKTTAGTFALDS